jgi:hypothetical protein
MLVVAAAGTFPGTGPTVRIDSVSAVNHSLTVFVRTAICHGLWAGGQMVVAPVDMVRVPASYREVRFVERETSFPGCMQ